jgi:hypothetical protein
MARQLSRITVEWLDRVARPGEAPDETIARLVSEKDRDGPPGPDEDLLVRRDALLHLDDL